jgi:hypothetical protein
MTSPQTVAKMILINGHSAVARRGLCEYIVRIERMCLMLKVIRGKKFYPLD